MPVGSALGLEHMKESIVMSAANTFTEEEYSLHEDIGKMNRNRTKIKVMKIYAIFIELAAVDTIAADDGIMLQITTNHESAEVYVSDKDLVYKFKNEYSGIELGEKPIMVQIWFNEPLIFPKKRLWVGVNTAGQAAASTFHFDILHKLGYESVYKINRMITSKI